MKIYMATTAYGFSPEVPLGIARSKAGAEMMLAERYPELRKTGIDKFDPHTGDKNDQAYVRELQLATRDLRKKPLEPDVDEDGRWHLYMLTTAYLNPTGLEYESPMEVLINKDEAKGKVMKYFPTAREVNPDVYLSTIRTRQDTRLTTVIQIKEVILAA